MVVFGHVHSEQPATDGESLLAVAIAHKPVIANTPQPVRQHMQQETPDELVSGEGHGFDLIALAIIFPAEANLIVFHVQQAVIGDGDAMGIAAHVVEHLLRPGERSFGVDDPFALFQSSQMPGECRPLPEWFQCAEELKFAGIECFLQPIRGRVAETNGTEPERAGRNPACRKPSGPPGVIDRRRELHSADADENIRFCPQLCSTAKKPISAPRLVGDPLRWCSESRLWRGRECRKRRACSAA